MCICDDGTLYVCEHELIYEAYICECEIGSGIPITWTWSSFTDSEGNYDAQFAGRWFGPYPQQNIGVTCRSRIPLLTGGVTYHLFPHSYNQLREISRTAFGMGYSNSRINSAGVRQRYNQAIFSVTTECKIPNIICFLRGEGLYRTDAVAFEVRPMVEPWMPKVHGLNLLWVFLPVVGFVIVFAFVFWFFNKGQSDKTRVDQ